jgi:hypothetical protein
MTRDAYAKAVLQAAEAAFRRNEIPLCPHENCNERLSIVKQRTFSTRSLFCPVHGHIYQEQEEYPFGKLDWEGAAKRLANRIPDLDDDDDEEEDDEESCDGYLLSQLDEDDN